MSLRCHHINGRAKIKITRSDCTIAKGNITIHLALNKKQLDFHDKVKQVLKLRRDTKLSLADKLFRRMIVVMDTKGVLKQRTKLRPLLDCKFLQSGHCNTFRLYLTNFVRS